MIKVSRVAYGLFAVVVITVSGCASQATKKPEGPSASGPSVSQAAPRQDTPGGVSRAATREPTGSPSSLDALREGKSAATSGPLRDIYFDFDRYDLKADARDILKANADWLKSNPLTRVEIEGHCDERGTNEYNLALGAKRAQSAKDYLVTLGISAERISTISYGEEIPVCKEQNEGCWQKNRRGRFVILTGRPAL